MFSWQHFLLAVGFYTRLSCPGHSDYEQLPKACIYLPLIGWLVGGISAIAFLLADRLWSSDIAVIIALIAGILTTGAFHEDGFADVCDGFGGGYGRQRILDIMKDSHLGVYGTLGLLLLMLLKFSLLSGFPTPADIAAVLFAGHGLSRWPPLYLMYRYDYARTGASKSAGAVYRPDSKHLLLAGIPALLPLGLLPLSGFLTLIPVAIATLYLGRYFYRHIGGYTGDCLGACQQVGEVVFYLSAYAVWTFI